MLSKSKLLPNSKSMGKRRVRFEMPNFVGLSGTEKGNDGMFYAKRMPPHRMKIEKTEDLEVDVPEQVDDLSEVGPANGPDASEYSSSFGSSFSGSSDLMDEEMDSQFHGENGAFTFSDGFNKVVRKKKLTEHWRRFILPLMWRCKWIELRMKELRSQALKYEKELSAYDQEKLLQEKIISSYKSVAGAVPMTHQTRMIMRRRKRKRIEETVDILSYMSSHNIFSYYERGFKDVDHLLDDGYGDQVVSVKQNSKGRNDLRACYEWSMLDFSYCDNSLEKFLFDIEAMKSQVFKLRTQLNEVICENSGEFLTSSSCPQESPPYSCALQDPPYKCALNPSCSPVSSYETAADPDIIEVTVDLLSSAINASMDQNQIGGLGDDLVDEYLIENRAAEEELESYKFIHLTENAQEDTMKESEKTNIASTVSISETELETKKPLKRRHLKSDLEVRKSKRKQVERTLSPGSWNGKKIRRRRSSRA